MHALLLGLTLAAGPHTVLVLDLNVRSGVSPDLAQTLSELMAIEVRKIAPGQRIYSGADIKALIGFKKQKAMLGCEDSSCLAELGGALGAQEIVTGSLSFIAEDYVLVLRRMDVAKSSVIEEVTANVPKATTAKLQEAVRDGIDKLWRVAPVAVPEPAVSVSAEPRRSHVLPIVLGGVAVAALAASAVGFVEVASFYSLRSGSAKNPVTYAQAQSAQSSAQWGAPLGFAGLGVAVAAGTGAVIAW
jgi:hypothetical protein